YFPHCITYMPLLCCVSLVLSLWSQVSYLFSVLTLCHTPYTPGSVWSAGRLPGNCVSHTHTHTHTHTLVHSCTKTDTHTNSHTLICTHTHTHTHTHTERETHKYGQHIKGKTERKTGLKA